MADELKDPFTPCEGDCASCESDCEGTGGMDLDQPTVTLTLDDDTEVKCAILNIFDVEDKQYIALLPLNNEGVSESGEVYLYKYFEDANHIKSLDNIEDEDEYQAAADAFNDLMENQFEGIFEETSETPETPAN